MKKFLIEKIHARQILDSRGNPTVEVDAVVNGVLGRSAVPSGASTGAFECCELRDNDKTNYLGKSVEKAVNNVNKIIAKELVGMNAINQSEIDNKLIALDGTKNKTNLGGNAVLGVSLAVSRAVCNAQGKSYYDFLGGGKGRVLPVPMMNILNGGKHADSNLNIQEFMIVPIGANSFKSALKMCTEVYHTLKSILKSKKLSTAVGDEGGFAPKLENDEQAFILMHEAIKTAGYEIGKDFGLAVDAAASEMFNEAEKIGKAGSYYFWKTNQLFSCTEMINYWAEMSEKYSIISIEDPLSEEDWAGWKEFTKKLGKKVQIVGDDLFVTNIERLQKGIDSKTANSILIKLNQIGTLSETFSAIETAHRNGYTAIVSHRSGETEDTTIADLVVALNCGQIKTGAPARTDRVCKYNQLLRIEEELGKKALYLGIDAFNPQKKNI